MICTIYRLSGEPAVLPYGKITETEMEVHDSQDWINLLSANNCYALKFTHKASTGSDYHVIELQDEPQ